MPSSIHQSLYTVLNTMRKTLILSAGAVAVLLGVGWLVIHERSSVDNGDQVSPTPSVSAAASWTPRPVVHTVRLTALGPNPKSLTVRLGDAVTFTNETDTPFWPYSDACPAINADRGLLLGEKYTLTFTTRRICPYYNYLDPYRQVSQGTITIQ